MKQYLDLLQDVLDNGELVSNGRTKEAYYSVFGRQVRYNLREGFPLVTTKKMFTKGIIHELLWFLKGDTNVKYLQDNGVKIWDEWATKEQCAKFGRKEGDLGPVYGHQWKRFGASEVDHFELAEAGWTNQEIKALNGYHHDGVDQIARLIDDIKKNPTSRRLIVTGWNPKEADKVALPPCHTLFQFKVSHGGTRLNCQLYQRSCDAALGMPFNIASYALLTHMIAQVCGLEVGDFVHTFGDLHIYVNQIDGIKEQLTRKPLPLPTLWLNSEIKNIDHFKYEDIKIINYSSHPKIEFPIAI